MRVSSFQFPISRSAATLAATIALSLAASAFAAPAADPAEDLEAQYQTALAVLRKPPVTGILITEVQPESAAAAAGLRAGDILLEYYGTKVTSLQALSNQVAEVIARRLEDQTAGKNIYVKVRRGNDERSFILPRELLGIRALEVEAGVAGPRNPPPNPRGMLDLDWKTLLQTLRTDNATPDPADAVSAHVTAPVTAAFRLLLHVDAVPSATQPRRNLHAAEEDWAGWELCTLTPEGDGSLTGKIDLYHLMPAAAAPGTDDQPPPTEHSAFTFKLRLGDYKTAPAFVLESATQRYAAPRGQENMQYVATAQRLGEKLQIASGLAVPETSLGDGGNRTERHENAAQLSAAPQWALPWIAAALPQQDGDALAVYVLSMRDMLPRPGYVLATRGRSPLPPDPEGADATPASPLASQSAPAASPTASTTTATAPAAASPDPFRVDLVHCGIVIESYWFTDQRRLLCIQTQGPQSLIARRAETPKSASSPMDKKQNP